MAPIDRHGISPCVVRYASCPAGSHTVGSSGPRKSPCTRSSLTRWGAYGPPRPTATNGRRAGCGRRLSAPAHGGSRPTSGLSVEAEGSRFAWGGIDQGGRTMWVRVATFEGGDTEKLDKLMD